jgi:hypothetical protein
MKLPNQAKPIAREQSQARTSSSVLPSGCCCRSAHPLSDVIVSLNRPSADVIGAAEAAKACEGG